MKRGYSNPKLKARYAYNRRLDVASEIKNLDLSSRSSDPLFPALASLSAPT